MFDLPWHILIKPTINIIANAKSLAAVKKFCTAVAHFTLAQLMNKISTETYKELI